MYIFENKKDLKSIICFHSRKTRETRLIRKQTEENKQYNLEQNKYNWRHKSNRENCDTKNWLYEEIYKIDKSLSTKESRILYRPG